MTKKQNNDKTFSITMNKEHLSQSLQAYFRSYGYLNNDEEYFDVTSLFFLEEDNMIEVKGDVSVG